MNKQKIVITLASWTTVKIGYKLWMKPMLLQYDGWTVAQ